MFHKNFPDQITNISDEEAASSLLLQLPFVLILSRLIGLLIPSSKQHNIIVVT